jgi:flagellar motor switch protein FliM
MADIMDQNEVDALLKGVFSGDVETGTDLPPAGMDVEEVSYDLTNPERIIRGKMPTLVVIHDKFVKLFEASLTGLLRKDVVVQTLSTEVMKYKRFIERIALPTSLSILKVEPYRGVAIFEMGANIVFRFMDMYCGGTGGSGYKVKGRDFTSIEQRLIGKIVNMVAADLMESWKPVIPITISMEKIEVNPRFITAVERDEMLLVYTFEVEIDQNTCNVKLCIPYATIEPFRVQLSGDMVGERELKQDKKSYELLQQTLKQMMVNVVAEVGQGDVTLRDLLNLQVGDVIPISKKLNSPFDIKSEGVKKFEGYPGQFKNKVAVQITSSIEEEGE